MPCRYVVMLSVAVIVMAGGVSVPVPGVATVMTDCPGGTCSLQELFDGGTIRINDKVFTSWRLFSLSAHATLLPDPRLIEVLPIDDSLNPGLRYDANGQFSVNGQPSTLVFRVIHFGYVVGSLDGLPRIKDHRLELQDFRLAGDAGFVRIDEGLCPGELSFCSDERSLEVFAHDVFDQFRLSDSLEFTPQSIVFSRKDISAAVCCEAGATAALETFEERWSQVPGLASLTLVSVGLACVIAAASVREWAVTSRGREPRTKGSSWCPSRGSR